MLHTFYLLNLNVAYILSLNLYLKNCFNVTKTSDDSKIPLYQKKKILKIFPPLYWLSTLDHKKEN